MPNAAFYHVQASDTLGRTADLGCFTWNVAAGRPTAERPLADRRERFHVKQSQALPASGFAGQSLGYLASLCNECAGLLAA